MKILFACLIILACLLPKLNAQNIDFQNLKLTTSPAFVILGVEPDNIQRPSSPSKFVAGIQNAIVDDKLQPNLAFEINPYSLFKKEPNSPKSFNAYKYLTNTKGLHNIILQSFSLSIGSAEATKETFGAFDKGTALGLGLHFQLVAGKANSRLKDWNKTDLETAFYRTLRAAIRNDVAANFNYPDILAKTIEDFNSTVLPAYPINTLSNEELKTFYKSLDTLTNSFIANKIENDKGKIVTALDALYQRESGLANSKLANLNSSKNPLTKVGFILEVAAGQAYVLTEGTFNGASHAKSAIWVTPSWRWDVSKDGSNISLLDFMLVGRCTFNNQSAGVDPSNYLDAGIKGNFTQNKWTASIEGIYRHATNLPDGFDKNYTYRLVTGFDYKISDAVTLNANFGTNFDGNSITYTDPKEMFAVAGINFGFMNMLK